jgi:pantoate--beta-alanine ligase
MIVITSINELRAELAKRRKLAPEGRIGFVPTMGYLHEGHASLMRRAKQECGFAVLSVFVNPLQFGPNEDFDRYPRDFERDRALAESCGVDVMFMPSVQEMYPKKPLTTVRIEGLTDRLCGASRPGHFDGVGTVVSKLFHIVQPDRAYFGLKDAQQIAVIRRMVDDLNIPVEIVPCDTVREPDGLAKSSRNVYLNDEERRQAVILAQTLEAAGRWLTEPGTTGPRLAAKIRGMIAEAPLAEIDYAEVLEYPDLERPADSADLFGHSHDLIVALAVKFGRTRLIDNRIFSKHGGEKRVQNDDEVEAAPRYRDGSELELCR